MHSSELKNLALVAAVAAERDNFPATAAAFRNLAELLFVEAQHYGSVLNENATRCCSGGRATTEA